MNYSLIRTLAVILVVLSLGPSSLFAKDGEQFEELFDELRVFTDVLSIVDRDYVREVSSEELVEGAIKGMLTTLDPHSGYLEPDFYQDLRVQTKGEFGGLGIEITIKDGLLVVVAPMEGSPAEKAGILPGDKIVKIEGKFTKEFSLVDAVKRLRGPKGTPINISVLREGESDLRDITIIRDRIAVKSVRQRMLEPGYGYVRLSQFVESSADDLHSALKQLKSESDESGLQGLVLDLRNNPGGLLTQAIRVVDLFLRDGVIVYTDGRVENQRQKFFAHERGTEPEYPIIVLINGGSASASEIVAGAFQDHGRGLVLGTKSFGKGSVQTITPLSNGGALTLTTALYYTASGRSIQLTGVEPDIVYEQVIRRDESEESDTVSKRNSSGMREADLPGAIKNPNGGKKKSNKKNSKKEKNTRKSPRESITRPGSLTTAELLKLDSQLSRALDLLKTYRIFGPGKAVEKHVAKAKVS